MFPALRHIFRAAPGESAILLGLLALGGLVPVAVLGLLQFVFLGLFLVRFEALAWPWNSLGYLLPLTPSVMALRLLLGRGEAPGWDRLVLAGVNALVYLTLGVGFFRRALRRVRRQGTLGAY
ncbi:hypothetical protein [Calidithermus timidus]|uniref:hypothetical protein n=1 Tax=Calidithermus timidus TaxID=307124 RepID=UPI00037DE23E|nr:hypothetical protein [Calidithermus timidus]